MTTPGPYLVTGRMEEQDGTPHLAVEELSPFHLRARPDAAPRA